MLHKILELAAKLPSGIPDPGAHYKLVVEGRELSAADDPDPLSDRVEHIETRIATLAAQVARLAGAA